MVKIVSMVVSKESRIMKPNKRKGVEDERLVNDLRFIAYDMCGDADLMDTTQEQLNEIVARNKFYTRRIVEMTKTKILSKPSKRNDELIRYLDIAKQFCVE